MFSEGNWQNITQRLLQNKDSVWLHMREIWRECIPPYYTPPYRTFILENKIPVEVDCDTYCEWRASVSPYELQVGYSMPFSELWIHTVFVGCITDRDSDINKVRPRLFRTTVTDLETNEVLLNHSAKFRTWYEALKFHSENVEFMYEREGLTVLTGNNGQRILFLRRGEHTEKITYRGG